MALMYIHKRRKILNHGQKNWNIPKEVTSSFSSLQLKNQLNCGIYIFLDSNDRREMRIKLYWKFVL